MPSTSNYYNILSAVQTRCSSIVTNTVLRKKVELLETDTLPICIVAPGPTGEAIVQQTMNRGVWYEYPVLVGYIAANNGAVILSQTFLETRESLRNVLFQILLTGASAVFDTNIVPQEAFLLAAHLGTNYDTAAFIVKYRVAETRTS